MKKGKTDEKLPPLTPDISSKKMKLLGTKAIPKTQSQNRVLQKNQNLANNNQQQKSDFVYTNPFQLNQKSNDYSQQESLTYYNFRQTSTKKIIETKKDFLNNRTLMFISNQDPIEIQPSEIIFKDIKINQTYEINVYVRNLTKKVRRIRVFQPQTPFFRVDYDMQGAIAAGLAMKLTITFETQTPEDCHDMIQIISDNDYEKNVPLHAYATCGQLIFEPFINLGFVKLKKEKKESIMFKNEGNAVCKVELKCQDCKDIQFQPSSFQIKAGSEYEAFFTYTPQEAGIYRGIIDVITDGQCIQKYIDVNATSVDFNRFIIDENGAQVTQFDFGVFYYGQKKQVVGYLVNNTPKKYKFKTRFRFGLLYNLDDITNLQPPNVFGRELTEKIMFCEPSEGIINSYSQIQLLFQCQSQVEFDNKVWTQKYSLDKQEMSLKIQDYSYSAIFEFEGEPLDPTILHLTGRGICPMIKINKHVLHFGNCQINEHREMSFEIVNRNKEISVDVNIPCCPGFQFSPQNFVLLPEQQSIIVVTFRPKSIGQFKQNLILKLIDHQYELKVKLIGSCTQINQNKEKLTRGPESLPEDFDFEKIYIDDEKEENLLQDFTNKNDGLQSDEKNFQSKGLQKSKIGVYPKFLEEIKNDTQYQLEKIKEFQRSYDNRQKYNNELKSQRYERLKSEKEIIIQRKFQQIKEKLKILGFEDYNGKDDDSDKLEQNTSPKKWSDVPIDYEYEVGMVNANIQVPHLPLPEAKETLFVTKPIDDYEPQNQLEAKQFDMNPNVMIKKKFPSEPKNHSEIRDSTQQLTGLQLQKIFAGPTHINFGNVYLNSEVVKCFKVRNDLRTSISAKLFTDRVDLKKTYQQTQIIPSGQTAGFEVVLNSKNVGPLKTNVKYFINEKHPFEFQIIANIELVKLEMSKSQMRMSFTDENVEMFTTDCLKLTNNGNAPAKFSWVNTNSFKCFSVKPEDGLVAAGGGTVECIVTYTPSNTIPVPTNPTSSFLMTNQNNNQQISRTEEEKLILKIVDGQDQQLKCIGTFIEARCNLKISSLDLKQIPVAQLENKSFEIKNSSRQQAVYSVDLSKLPPSIEIINPKGKIGPDESKIIYLKFYSKQELEIKGDIVINIRGGKTLRLPYYMQTIIPDIQIEEEKFDFGNITTLGNPGQATMNIINNSSITAQLILDLRTTEEIGGEVQGEKDGVDCLEVNIIKEDEQEESVLHAIEEGHEDTQQDNSKQNENILQKNNEIDFDDDRLSQSSEGKSDDDKKPKYFILTMKPGQRTTFQLKFSPKNFKLYKFRVPIVLKGFGVIPGLDRLISCRGLKPKFLIDPQVLDFQKKIIIAPDKAAIGKQKQLSFSNPDKNTVKWRIDTSSLEQRKVFDIKPSSGEVGPGETKFITVSFNPFEQDFYREVLPLYVDDPEIQVNTAYMDIILKGEGAFPKLQFDRKEILMPVVPLDVESRCVFRIINSGYENLNLKYKIIDDLQKINLKLDFPEGKNLGISKTKIKVEASFITKKPISFTTRIEFYDDADRIYDIYISGTSDNCLFTNFSYFQRCQGEYKIELDHDRAPLRLLENDNDINSDVGEPQGKKKPNTGGAASVVSNKTLSSYGNTGGSMRGVLGYTPIQNQFLEQNVEFLTRWLNFHVFTQPLQNFPQSIIENNGSQLFEILVYLTRKNNFPFKQTFENSIKRTDRVQKLYKQYDELIRNLKTEGALLNHIRPEHLFSYSDYIFYMKTLPQKKLQYLSSSILKLSQQKFQYISIETWTTLMYQMLKIYYLSKVTLKQFKNMQGIPPERQQIPDYLEGSNFIGLSESLILHWFQIQFEVIHLTVNRRLRNFDEDFQDSNMFSAAIQAYIGKSSQKHFQQMKQSCSNTQEITFNAEKLIAGFSKVGLQTHLSVKDLVKPSMREILLSSIQLFHSLPHYIPKEQTILFQCVLGEEVVKNIELTNPTNKPISFWVNLDPPQGDFSLEGGDSFVIEPGIAPYKYKVKFTSRVSEQVTAKIRFTNKKESNVCAAALVFELKSQITGRISDVIWNVNTPLYESLEKVITFTNKFSSNADFQIILIPEKFKTIQDDKKKRAIQKEKSQNENYVDIQNQTSQSIQNGNNSIFPAFFCQRQSIKVLKQQTVNIPIIFIPLQLETQKSYIIFRDPAVGECQHEIIGTVEFPNYVSDIFRFPSNQNNIIYVDETHQQEQDISHINELMMKARRQIEQIFIEKNRDKQFSKVDINPVANKSSVMKNEKINFPGGQLDSVNYEVEIIPPCSFIFVKNQITVANPYKIRKDNPPVNNKIEDNQSALLQGSGQNKLPFQFVFKQPVKDYKFLLVLKNSSKTDIRRYRCEVTAYPKPIKAILEFRVPARHSTIQEIPIVNNSDKEWNIKATLYDGKNAYLFTTQSALLQNFIIKKKSTGVFPIKFSPVWICEAESKLTFFNPLTNDQFEYVLKGFGEEPVAEDHIIIFCKAKQQTLKEIEIKNPYMDREVTYRVETDLISCSGENTITIKPGRKAKYVLNIMPILSGQYTGSITFYENDQKYLWYTILLNTDSPKADKCVDLQTFIRQAVSLSIEIKNPLNQPVIFDVAISGDGLVGDNQLYISPNSQSKYELVYSPLTIGKGKGSVAFMNEFLGEIWYELNLSADEPLPQRLNLLKCELGKVECHEIYLENPSDKEVRAQALISNPTNYTITPDNIILKPQSKTLIQIIYMPSNLDTQESAEIIINTQEIGSWKFIVFGMGIPPTKFPQTVVSVGLNKDFSSTIHFKNPFKEAINVTCTMENGLDAFKVITKGKSEKLVLQVPGLNVVQIPFSFAPREINTFYAELVVSMNDKIQWRYPVKGITESIVNQIIYHIKTQCRQQSEQELKIQLPGIVDIKGQEDLFSLELDEIQDEFSKLIKQSIIIKPIKNYLDFATDELLYLVKFTPLKPFKSNIDLNIIRQTGGRWKFKIILEATEPKEDDIIHISSNLHKTTTVSFKLTNKSKCYTPFTAAFTPDSDAEFTVTPKSGELEQYGREGTTFYISFTPIEYGKPKNGKLIIQTEEMLWIYIVKGTLPKYNPPIAEQSMIDNRIDQVNLMKLQNSTNKNFLAENVNKVKSPNKKLN